MSKQMGKKTILIVNDALPHGLEFMEEAIVEARRRGYHLKGIYTDRGSGVKKTLERLGITDLREGSFAGGKPETPEKVSETKAMLDWADPFALFLSLVGEGRFNGLFLIEANQRGLRSLVLGDGIVPGVPYFGPDTPAANEKMEKALRAEEFGPVPWQAAPESIRKTGWAGLDRLQQPFDQATFKKSLGMNPEEKLITFAGSWAGESEFARMTEEDLKLFSEQAERNNGRLAFSPHPHMLYGQCFLEGFAVHIPENVIPVSYVPMELMGVKMHWARIVDLIRASDFLILHNSTGVLWLALATGIPIWLRDWSGRARRALHDYLVKYAWRTDAQLEALFKGGLGPRIPEDARQSQIRHLHMRLDGKTAVRIVDLIE